ncbi:MAG: hypothetical protein CMD18_03265 [Flavobacteriales bacterium]|nr:hypothetical protein [Flavobacteriales bacterium]
MHFNRLPSILNSINSQIFLVQREGDRKAFSAFSKDEISSKNNKLTSDDTQSSSKQVELYLRGLEILDEQCFINIKRNNNFQPVLLYISNSLENETIINNKIISEAEYAESGYIESYKQQISDLINSICYSYSNDKVDLTHLEGASYYSCDLPFVGEGTTSVHDFKKDLAYIVASSGEDTLFYEIKNGNVIKISTVEHVLYEYTYDNKPYFAAGIMYDFFSTEFDLKWWFLPEFVPKNNITSIKKYSYADGGTFSTDEDEIIVRNFSYDYNEYNYPIQIKMLGETLMRFFYDIK